jgi:hypothetical protein
VRRSWEVRTRALECEAIHQKPRAAPQKCSPCTSLDAGAPQARNNLAQPVRAGKIAKKSPSTVGAAHFFPRPRRATQHQPVGAGLRPARNLRASASPTKKPAPFQCRLFCLAAIGPDALGLRRCSRTAVNVAAPPAPRATHFPNPPPSPPEESPAPPPSHNARTKINPVHTDP